MSDPKGPIELGYEPVAEDWPRPKWVWLIVGLYLLAAAMIVLLPGIAALFWADEVELLITASISAGVLTLCGMGLLFTRVQTARRRPMTRRSVLIPIISAAFLLGLLVMGAGFAIAEWTRQEELIMGAMAGGAVVWVFWGAMLWHLTSWRDPTSLAAGLHRWVLGGSVAELLVAVPAHLVVRRRTQCCAGIYTATAICIGVAVMIVSFGPSVAILYVKRWQRIRNK